jgi:hypothetical protein
MKINVFFFTFVLMYIGNSCIKTSNSYTENSNKVYFTINPENGKIIIPMQLNDSITANMCFDSGYPSLYSRYTLDSLFVASHPRFFSGIFSDTIHTVWSTAWSSKQKFFCIKYNDATQIGKTIKVGNTNVMFSNNTGLVVSWRQRDYDGIFNVPSDDTTHIWELNFDHNYLEIHSTKNFVMPENCLLCPLENIEKHHYYKIRIPMQMECADGDILITNHLYIVDTGILYDVILATPPDDLAFFHRKKDAPWVSIVNGHGQRNTVKATLFDHFAIDSLRIYTYDKVSTNLVGLNFLKQFNVFFDMKNKQIGLQPIKNFERIVDPNRMRFHCRVEPNTEGKFIIEIMADYKENYFKTAGLKEGDEVVAVNDISFKNLTLHDHHEMISNSNTLIYDIIRNGRPLKIAVPINKNEERGD